MKKFILLLVGLFILASCENPFKYEKDYTTTVTYRVHYPDTTVTMVCSFPTTDTPECKLNSSFGSNYITLWERKQLPSFYKTVIETTVPLELVDVTTTKNEKP